MGYYIGLSRFVTDRKRRRALMWKGYLSATFYHGLFNFLLFTESLYSFLVLPLLIYMALDLRKKIKLAHKADAGGELPFQFQVKETKPIVRTLKRIAGVILIILSLLLIVTVFVPADVIDTTPLTTGQSIILFAIGAGIGYGGYALMRKR